MVHLCKIYRSKIYICNNLVCILSPDPGPKETSGRGFFSLNFRMKMLLRPFSSNSLALDHFVGILHVKMHGLCEKHSYTRISLEGDLGERVSLSWLTSPYFALRQNLNVQNII